MNFTSMSFLLRLNCKINFQQSKNNFSSCIKQCDRPYFPENQKHVQSISKNSRLMLLSVFKVNSKNPQKFNYIALVSFFITLNKHRTSVRKYVFNLEPN